MSSAAAGAAAGVGAGALGANGALTTAYSRQAREILGEGRFRPAPLPRPLHGVLAALGNAFAPAGRAIGRAFSAVAKLLPGGGSTLWVVVGVAIVGVAGILAARMTGRTLVDHARTGPRLGGAPGAPDAGALEIAADLAEREGAIEQAVRLRFQAGLLRLDELGVLTYRPSLPNAAVSRRLGSPVFDELLRRFEEVVYGGRPAEPADARGSRDGWRQVLGDAGHR